MATTQRGRTLDVGDMALALDRYAQAIALCNPIATDTAHGNPHVTKDMLLCDMQRIHDLLTGRPYYDYAAQKWVDDEHDEHCRCEEKCEG